MRQPYPLLLPLRNTKVSLGGAGKGPQMIPGRKQGGGQQLEGVAEGSKARLRDVCIQDLFWGLKVGVRRSFGISLNSGPFVLTQHHSLSPPQGQANWYPLFPGLGVLNFRSLDPPPCKEYVYKIQGSTNLEPGRANTSFFLTSSRNVIAPSMINVGNQPQ